MNSEWLSGGRFSKYELVGLELCSELGLFPWRPSLEEDERWRL